MALPRKRRKAADGPRLWKIWIAIPIVVLFGLVTAVATGGLIWLGLGRPKLGAVDGWDAQAQLETVRLALFVVGGIGGVVALVVAYRKQRVNEASDRRENSKLFNDRFLAACAELGNDAAAVRLAAVYALARLADDWRPERQTCIDVLCAYLRLPYVANPEGSDWKQGEREVRLSIVRIIRDHLRKTLEDPLTWQGFDFDFTTATFDDGDLSGANFSAGTVSFLGAIFSGGMVSFQGTRFSGAEVNFVAAAFVGSEVSFHKAAFSGGKVNFYKAAFATGGVDFTAAVFSGGKVGFLDAEFCGSKVSFSGVTFSGGEVSFGAKFTAGTVDFPGAKFTGSDVSFVLARFAGGEVDFERARFPDNSPAFAVLLRDPPPGVKLPDRPATTGA